MSDVPEFVQQLWREERWAELLLVCRAKWNRRAGLYLKQNRNAVLRVKQVFTQITGKPPFQRETNQRYWDEQIAKYLDRLGVAALIDDMKAAHKANPKIGSIVYFLWSKDLRPRWEILLMRKLEDEYRQQKHQDNDAYAAMARLLGLENQQTAIQLDPDWVVEAQRNMKHLQRQLQTAGDLRRRSEIMAEIIRIKNNLQKWGFSE